MLQATDQKRHVIKTTKYVFTSVAKIFFKYLVTIIQYVAKQKFQLWLVNLIKQIVQ